MITTDDKKRKLQIGVMGSAADLKYSLELAAVARKVGELLALAGCVVMYGAEKDYDSLSTQAAASAAAVGGLTVGVTYGKSKKIFVPSNGIVVCTGLERGGGREFSLVLSCDAIITIGGGSGTLTEAAIAYQAGIPIVGLSGTGGWTSELCGRFLDERKRVKVEAASNPEEAVEMAVKSAEEKMKGEQE